MKAIEFKGVTYTQASVSKMSGPALVKLHNELNPKKPTKRFAAQSVGVSRVWKSLEAHAATAKPAAPAPVRKASAPAAKKAAPKSGIRRGTNLLPPGFEPIPCRAGSKQAIMVDTLARKGGATLDDLRTALEGGRKPWQDQTIRAGFGWDMKLKGYGVRSNFKDGVERFYLVVPEGQTIPAHTPLKSAKVKAAASAA